MKKTFRKKEFVHLKGQPKTGKDHDRSMMAWDLKRDDLSLR
jgi:hypothetical protein